jgi:lipopolysaccharide transport system permease protein
MALGAALFHSLMSIAVWTCAYVAFYGLPPLTIVLAPFTLIPFTLVVLGGAWFLSSLGVYLRDITQVVGLFITLNLFLSSIFYPLTALPEAIRSVVALSPLTAAVEQFRQVVFFGQVPNLAQWTLQLVVGGMIASAGFTWFQRTRKGFADVV